MMKSNSKVIAYDIFLVVLCVASFLWFSRISTSKAVYSSSIETLDEKKDNVMRLTAISAGASFAVSLIPGDAGDPIADKLADLTGYFIVITIGIYIEKWMIAIMGIVAFKVIIPIGCIVLLILSFFNRPDIKRTTVKLMIFSIVLTLVVPCSTWVSQTIDTVSDQTISNRVEELQKNSDEVVADTKDGDDSSITGKLSSLWSKVSGGVKGVLAKFETLLRNMIDTIAAMIVTSCIIPILVFVFLICITNMIFGKALRIPDPKDYKLSNTTRKVREALAENKQKKALEKQEETV